MIFFFLRVIPKIAEKTNKERFIRDEKFKKLFNSI